ncbi:PAS domain S-box protein [Pelagicoccus mobilis]|uniref:Sensory/regulatory protein RpfC n=1 Tax=Pelagicoccus mobilis TaxID=415221 RepID=A0A934VUA9_9BACT|nr:PAS domain S-box protein [Pelagicoccus mobilis]MBK1880354.1 PAS domain S-box protein [Pelagicoccus mobilis]
MSQSPTERDQDLDASKSPNGSLEQSTVDALMQTLDDHVIVAVTDPRGVITYANDQFCRISGYSREELLGKTHQVVKSGYHPASFWEALWGTISSGRTWKGQVCNRAKDGTLYWVQTTIHPILKEDGSIKQYVAFRTDITAQKEVENKLRHSQMHLQEASRIAKLGAWELDLVAQKLSWSWTTKIIHEVPPDFEPDLASALEFYPEGVTRDRITHLVERAMETGEPWDEELQIQTLSGKVKWVRAIGQAEMLDAQCVRLYGVFQDIDDERRLREVSEQNASLLRSMVDAATEFGVIATDKEGTITVFNVGAEKLLGYRAEEVVGQATPELIHLKSEIDRRSAELTAEFGEQVGGFDAFVKVSILQGSEQREWTYVRKDGSHVPVTLVVTPMRGASGEHTGYLGISRDMSAQKKAEGELKESESRFRRSFEYSGIGMAIMTTDGDWVDVNQALLEMLGYSREALLKLQFQDITHPDDLELSVRMLDEALSGERHHYTIEKRYFDARGEVIWVRLNVSLVRDLEGKPVNFISQIENISEAKAYSRDIKAATDRLALAVQAAGVGIWDLDLESGKLIWDEQMFALYGCDADSFEGGYGDWKRGVHPEDFEKTVEAVDAAIAGTREFDTEFRIVRKDTGEVRHLRALALVERDEAGDAVRMVGTNWDVTAPVKQKQALFSMARDAEEANRAKSQFLANMSHEIRTPINGVIGMTALLLDSSGLNSEQRKQAGVIKSSGEALLALINDILDFSKVEAGKLELEILGFGLRETLDDLNTLLAQRANEKQLDLICSAEAEVPDYLRGDPGRLRQILLNLAGNAIKFTESGEVKVRVSLESKDEKEATLRFSVTDTGIGISSDKRRNLFTEFTQADSSTTRLYGGTGLGLAISKQLVALMDGEIGVNSELGEGSEFWFTARFPYEEMEATEEGLHQLEGKSALVVVHKQSLRTELLDRFEEWGIRAESCSLASAGMTRLRELATAGRGVDFLVFDPDESDLSVSRFVDELKDAEIFEEVKGIVLSREGGSIEPCGLKELTCPFRRSELYNLLIEESKVEPGPEGESDFKDIAAEHFAGRAARVLVAEDNIVNQMVVRGVLGKFGLHADTVANGLEALEALGRIAYDLVLMDIQMPEMDGMEASRRIRAGESGESVKDVPIVALTAHARPEDKEECLAAGMTDYISKPVAPKVLFRLLDRMLPKSSGTEDEEGSGSDTREETEVFDRAMFISGMMDDENLAREIAELSLVDLQKHCEGLEEIFASGKKEDLLRATHSIKGVSAHACCNRLKEAAERLEHALRSGNEEEVRGGFADFSALLEQGMSALRGFLKS